jgi:hypothetical protein
MSTQEALALLLPAPSNTVVIHARCSLRIEADQRVIVVAGLPVYHYRAEDLVAEAYGRPRALLIADLPIGTSNASNDANRHGATAPGSRVG